jgi:hypothetical protein
MEYENGPDKEWSVIFVQFLINSRSDKRTGTTQVIKYAEKKYTGLTEII